MDAGADRQPEHQRPAADDSADDASRREAVAAYDPFRTIRRSAAIRSRSDACGAHRAHRSDRARRGDVVLRHEWMDVRRVVHMNMKEHPKNGPRDRWAARSVAGKAMRW